MADFTLTSLESQVLEWLLDGDDPVLAALRQQLASAKVKSRKYTGVGLYLQFDVPSNHKRLQDFLDVKQKFSFGDVEAVFGDQLHEVGFLLWVTDGYLDSLEAYTYGDEQWPDETNAFQMHYIGGLRDLESLRRNWEL